MSESLYGGQRRERQGFFDVIVAHAIADTVCANLGQIGFA
jgi:hypothetical protein